MNPNPRVVETGADVPSHLNNSTRDTSDNNMVGRMRCLEGVTMIAPNESRRKETLMIAQKEEDELQKWKEANRHTHVHTTPERLGGNATLAEVRERQFKDLRCSKMEKKLKQEYMAQKKRQEEEDEFKRKKHEQRKKAECLEEQKQVKEKKRQEQLRQDCAQVNSAFLDKLDRHEKGSEKTPMRKADVSHSPLSTDGQEKPGPHPEESCSGQMMLNDLGNVLNDIHIQER
uniref:Epithelial stromal interaction 1 n=1 Tax=Hippocampus comes TaxID=109280 RepID=A0A3Q2YKX8_HIPCM